MSNILIAYFSRKGQNYVDGQITDLAKGNTERVAESHPRGRSRGVGRGSFCLGTVTIEDGAMLGPEMVRPLVHQWLQGLGLVSARK